MTYLYKHEIETYKASISFATILRLEWDFNHFSSLFVHFIIELENNRNKNSLISWLITWLELWEWIGRAVGGIWICSEAEI